MPGFGGHRYDLQFPHGTPRPFKAAIGLFFANFVLNFFGDVWAEHYAPRYPGPAHLFPLHYKGSLVVFVPSWLGYYLEWGFWAHFILLAMLGLMAWSYVLSGRALTTPRDVSENSAH